MNRKIKTAVSMLGRGREFGYGLMLLSIFMASIGRWLPKRIVSPIALRQQAWVKRRINEFMSGLDWASVAKRCQNEDNTDGTIWICWLQGEANMPLIPRLCLDSIRKMAGHHEVIVLDADNYRDYVVLPEHIEQKYRKGVISSAHYSDCIRMNLLSQRGGLWLDATIFATKPIEESVFQFPFWSIKTPEEGLYVSRCRWAVFCMATPRGGLVAEFVAYALNEWWRHWNNPVDYLFMDYIIDNLYDHNDDIRQMIDAVPYNNPEVHSLRDLMGLPCSMEDLVRLQNSTSLFKLNWRQFPDCK